MAEGGCLCGDVRYRLDAAPIDAGYCHCRICQRSAGAPVLAWGTWPSAAFRWIGGPPCVYRSSAGGERLFCSRCGTQLLFRDSNNPDHVDVSLVTLDEPDAVPPEYHIWTRSRRVLFDTADRLPRHPDAGRMRCELVT